MVGKAIRGAPLASDLGFRREASCAFVPVSSNVDGTDPPKHGQGGYWLRNWYHWWALGHHSDVGRV